MKGISEQTTNFCILAFCIDQKVLALLLSIIKEPNDCAKRSALPFGFYLKDRREQKHNFVAFL